MRRRLNEALGRRADQMENSPILKVEGIPRKYLGEIIKKDFIEYI
jgi:hypothetical protein